ncbi:unnamed protein product, partial [Polarella glacialis]
VAEDLLEGSVEFMDPIHAQQAVDRLNNRLFDGQKISVELTENSKLNVYGLGRGTDPQRLKEIFERIGPVALTVVGELSSDETTDRPLQPAPRVVQKNGREARQQLRATVRTDRMLVESEELQALLALGPDQLSLEEVSKALAPWMPKWIYQPRIATSILGSLARQRRPELAELVLQSIREARVDVNLFHYNSVISAHEKSGRADKALGLLEQMQRLEVTPDTVSFNAAISACQKSADLPSALRLLRSMGIQRLVPNAITYSAAISACDRGGDWETALGLLSEMTRQEVMPNAISYTSAMRAMEQGGRWDMSLDLFSQMVRKTVPPDARTYNTAIAACRKGFEWETALHLLGEMPSRNVRRDLVSRAPRP